MNRAIKTILCWATTALLVVACGDDQEEDIPQECKDFEDAYFSVCGETQEGTSLLREMYSLAEGRTAGTGEDAQIYSCSVSITVLEYRAANPSNEANADTEACSETTEFVGNIIRTLRESEG